MEYCSDLIKTQKRSDNMREIKEGGVKVIF